MIAPAHRGGADGPSRRPLPRLTDRQPLGKSGLRVGPVCLGTVPGPGTVLAAFDAGINFFFVSADLHWPLYEGTRRGLEALLARGGGVRDEIVVGVVSYLEQPLFQALQVHEVINAVAGLERVDLIIAGGVSNPSSFDSRLEPMTYARNLKFRGARAIGASFHDRRQAVKAAKLDQLDILYVRYNTAHPGARTDLFPFLLPVRTGRIFNFKSTMFKVTAEMLRRLELSPTYCWLPDIPDYYRFALSRPELDGILASPKTPEE
ncbi:MAG TPA: hypothetical protein VGM86_05495, partial [Thermoanaerobaculia bacterium]